MSLHPGADVTLIVEKPAAGGRMIARHDGEVVLVGGTIPGERVRARVERVGRGVVYAQTREVLRAEPDRRGQADAHPCGGVVYAHIAYARQLQIKADVIADAFARIARLPLDRAVEVAPSPETGYRMRARLHAGGGRLGFYREGTHDLCDPATTGQMLPATIDVLAGLGARLAPLGLAGPGALELAENVPATQRVVHLEFDRRPGTGDLASLRVDGLTGASYSTRSEGGTHEGFGAPFATDDLVVETGAGGTAPFSLRHGPMAFFQANRYLLPVLVSRVARHAGDGAIIDLYAGVGLFAVAAAAAGARAVTAVEADRVSASDLRHNAAALGGAIRVLAMSVERFLASGPAVRGATLVVDPPRTGMTRAAMAGILACGADRLVYVSCDVATLARDAARLVTAGYRMPHLEAFDLFPNTAHVEALAVFER